MTKTVSTSAQQTVFNFNNWFSDNIYSICKKTSKHRHQRMNMHMFGDEGNFSEFVLFRVSDYGKAINLFRVLFDVDSDNEVIKITVHPFRKGEDAEFSFKINELDVEHDYKVQKKELKAYFEKN